MDLTAWIKFSTVIGGILSFLFEQVFFKWNGETKKWVFVAASLIIGGGLAIATKTIPPPAIDWGSIDGVFKTLINILIYGCGVLAAGSAWFKANITKKG